MKHRVVKNAVAWLVKERLGDADEVLVAKSIPQSRWPW